MKIKWDFNVIYIYVCFVVVTLSYVPSLPFGKYKMIAVAISIIYPLVSMVSKDSMQKQDLILIFVLFYSALLQDTSIFQKFMSLFFYVTLIMWSLHGNEIMKNLSCIYSSGMGIATGIFIGLMYSRNEILVQLSGVFNSRRRLYGGFSHPNSLGAMATAALVALFTYTVVKTRKTRKERFFLSAIKALLFIVLLETKSRTALIMFIVFLGVYNLHYVKKLKLIYQYFVYFLLVLGIVFIFYYFVTSYAQEDVAYAGRLKIFNTMVVTPKIFLVGNGMVGAASLDRTNTGGGAMEIAWVMLFYKNGIIGIIAYIYILYYIARQILLINNTKRKWLAIAVLSSMLIGTLGEAYIVNITNVLPMMEWILVSTLALKEGNFENH